MTSKPNHKRIVTKTHTNIHTVHNTNQHKHNKGKIDNKEKVKGRQYTTKTLKEDGKNIGLNLTSLIKDNNTNTTSHKSTNVMSISKIEYEQKQELEQKLEPEHCEGEGQKQTQGLGQVQELGLGQEQEQEQEQVLEQELEQEQELELEQEEGSEDQVLGAKHIKFTPQEILYYNRVNSFFKTLEERKFKHMVEILNGSSNISLRLLEWFITKYCDKYKTTKCTRENGESFVIFVGYKAALKSYRKRYFDPFKRNQKQKQLERKQKFCYLCTKNNNVYKVNTTLGQLHFFRWLFENNILNYMIKNLDSIKAAMEHDNRLTKKKKEEDRKNGIKKNKTKNEHKKLKTSINSSSVEISRSNSKGKSSMVISFD